METLNLDVLYLICLELADEDLLSLGSTNKYFYDKIFKRDRIWLAKLRNYQFENFKSKELYKLLKSLSIVRNHFRLDLTDLELYNRKELYLSNNKIKKIPKEISNLTNLQKLYLYNNQIEEIPNEISNLTNLRILSLFNNKINEIPKEITNLTNLQELYLHGNKITETQKEMKNLRELTI